MEAHRAADDPAVPSRRRVVQKVGANRDIDKEAKPIADGDRSTKRAMFFDGRLLVSRGDMLNVVAGDVFRVQPSFEFKPFSRLIFSANPPGKFAPDYQSRQCGPTTRLGSARRLCNAGYEGDDLGAPPGGISH